MKIGQMLTMRRIRIVDRRHCDWRRLRKCGYRATRAPQKAPLPSSAVLATTPTTTTVRMARMTTVQMRMKKMMMMMPTMILMMTRRMQQTHGRRSQHRPPHAQSATLRGPGDRRPPARSGASRPPASRATVQRAQRISCGRRRRRNIGPWRSSQRQSGRGERWPNAAIATKKCRQTLRKRKRRRVRRLARE